jgi:flagellar basal body-associated protein FliL
MRWTALILWVITAGGGFVLLSIWLARGGMQQAAQGGSRIRPPLILSHFLLAATGLVLWIIYLATDTDAIAWIAFAVLLVVALLGFTMLAIWLRQRQGAAGAVETAVAERPPEQHFPVPVVVAHGLLAATTLVLVLLAAAEVG